MSEELYHYGTPRHSGRYPWGSGDNPFQHESYFLDNVERMKKEGMSETEIAAALGMSTTELRKRKSIENEELKAAELSYAIKLKEKGYSNVAIGEKLGRNESYVRTLLKPSVEEKAQKSEALKGVIQDAVDGKRYIDIGPGSELMIDGASKQKFDVAIQKLVDEGYKIQYLKIEQAGNPGNYTTLKVLTQPDVDWKELNEHRGDIGLIDPHYTEDGGHTFLGIQPPTSVDSSRLFIKYAEDGGIDRDGVIELRRGVADLDLGNANYAQVRIAVDGTHYLKGMAVYSDDIPDGYDILFNTNKPKGMPALGEAKNNTVLKLMKKDPDNPFGTTLKMEDGVIVGQRHYIDKDGKEKLSPLNIVREEGDWNTWSATLASQFLSKQPIALIKQQLNRTYESKEDELKDILKLTNPEVKKMMLEEFANDCDASASHLKAAALPRQSSKVILPFNDIPDNEVYAPGYNNGEQVILIRYPHGGTFEIPLLTVNNRGTSAKDIIGNAIDAVGINKKVADRLSGADFDGDTVVVIPVSGIGQKIKVSSPLAGLADFDPKTSYPGYPGMKIMNNTQTEMGKISNLITDMTIKGATDTELARAVRHSMVVIDAEKHELNYKQSEIDNGIKELKIKYQGGATKGASTLISKASSELRVPYRKEKYGRLRTDEEQSWFESVSDKTSLSKEDQKRYSTIQNKMTKSEYDRYKNGEKIFVETGETYTKTTKSGVKKDILKTTKSTKMAETDDAYKLSSGTPKENEYANYANKLKSLANDARKAYRETPSSKVNKQAKDIYQNEVNSLNAKLNVALKNKPLERQAQIYADVTISAKVKDNPGMDSETKTKLKAQALAEGRRRTGASKKDTSVQITDKEWEAIQSGALSSNKISQILENTNKDRVKQLATPRSEKGLSDTQISRIKSLSANGYTTAEIANSLGVSSSTVVNYLK